MDRKLTRNWVKGEGHGKGKRHGVQDIMKDRRLEKSRIEKEEHYEGL